MTSGRGGNSNFVPRALTGDFGWEEFDGPCLLLWRLWVCWALDSTVLSVFLGSGRMVSSWGSISDQWPSPLIVTSSPPSKVPSQFSESSRCPSIEAKAFSRSPESRPPKLSCPLICGRWRALGEMAEAKSLSQLSSSVPCQPESISKGAASVAHRQAQVT